MGYKIYILRKLINNKWLFEGAYSSYKNAQLDFIYRDGLFSIEPMELDKRGELERINEITYKNTTNGGSQ